MELWYAFGDSVSTDAFEDGVSGHTHSGTGYPAQFFQFCFGKIISSPEKNKKTIFLLYLNEKQVLHPICSDKQQILSKKITQHFLGYLDEKQVSGG